MRKTSRRAPDQHRSAIIGPVAFHLHPNSILDHGFYIDGGIVGQTGVPANAEQRGAPPPPARWAWAQK